MIVRIHNIPPDLPGRHRVRCLLSGFRRDREALRVLAGLRRMSGRVLGLLDDLKPKPEKAAAAEVESP